MLAGFKSMLGNDSLETEDCDIPRCIQMGVRVSAKGGNCQSMYWGSVLGVMSLSIYCFMFITAILLFLMTNAYLEVLFR